MAELADPIVSTEVPQDAAPVSGAEAAREASRQMLEASLSVEQREQLQKIKAQEAKADKKAAKAERKAAKATEATKPATAAPEPVAEPEVKPAPQAPEPEAEKIDFGDDESKPAEPATDEAPVEDLSEDELAKLDEKARKRVLDASKEAAKVRKRAQEAEASLKEREAKLSEYESQVTTLQQTLNELQQRGAALAGNAFGRFTDPEAVTTWGGNAQEAVALLTAHERAVKAGRADETDTVLHILPNGDEVELSLKDKPAFETRYNDAVQWLDVQEKIKTNASDAGKIADRFKGTKGYDEARAAYAKAADLHTRLPELVNKAALYDTLMARKAVITFPDAAGAASKAPSPSVAGTSDKATPSADKPRPAPPSESSASTPRMANQMSGGDDAAARKSQLMEMAMTAKDSETQQKYLREAAMIPSSNRTIGAPGRRTAA